MITSDYLRTMTRYNRWQNESLYEAAATLTDEARRVDRGAFFGSIHGTLSHLYWADRIWLARFDLCEPPGVPQRQSASFIPDFTELSARRDEFDAELIAWADAYPEGPIVQSLVWYSGVAGREVEKPLALVFAHIINHQTHHRGQVHAMLTAAGARPEDTDLFIMPERYWSLTPDA